MEDSGVDAPHIYVERSPSDVLAPDESERLAEQLQEVSMLGKGTVSGTTSPQDQDSAAQYLRLDYKFITEIEAMIIKYRIETVIDGVSYEAHGRSNLTQFFNPGTS